MVLHKNSRFIYNNRIAVRIPNGLAMDYSHEVLHEEALELMAPDESFRLVIEFWDTPKGAQSFVSEVYEECDCITTLEPVHAVTAPCGLSGWATTYALSSEILEEFAFSLPGDTPALMSIWLSRFSDRPYDADLYEQAKAEVLANIETV